MITIARQFMSKDPNLKNSSNTKDNRTENNKTEHRSEHKDKEGPKNEAGVRRRSRREGISSYIKKKIYSPTSSLVLTLFTLIVSFLSLIVVTLESSDLVPGYLYESFRFFDRIFSLIFFTEFLVRLWFAKKKTHYLRWGWVDLLSALPLYEFKLLRIFRVIIIIRVLKNLFELKRFKTEFLNHGTLQTKINNTFLVFILFTFLLILTATVSILIFETDLPYKPNADFHINTLGKALWWSIVTITTVGYGDLYPISIGGKITAIILMLFGIGLFSGLTVYFSSILIKNFQNDKEQKKIKKEVINLKKELEEIKLLLKKRL